MSLNRHNLTLDEQFFQSVLSAAFTIQQHKDRRRLACQSPARQTQARPEAHEHKPPAGAPRDSDDPSFLVLPVAKETAKETIRQEKTDTIRGLAPEDAELTVQPIQLSTSDDARADAPADASTAASEASTELLLGVPNHLFREIIQQALQATHATGAAIALEQQGELICRATVGDFASEISKMINTGSGFTGVCASSGTMQLCSNTALDSRVEADACRKLGVGAIIVVPLLHQDRLLGLIAVFSRRPYAFGMRDLQALHDLAQKSAANLQLSAESANANPGHESSGCL
jgi:GAF domain-containing protein